MKARTRKLLAELQEMLDGPNDDALQRDIAVAELGAAACAACACGHDITATAAGLLGRFRSFPEAEWPTLFNDARQNMRRTSSDRDWPARSAALEQLIEAAKSAA